MVVRRKKGKSHNFRHFIVRLGTLELVNDIRKFRNIKVGCSSLMADLRYRKIWLIKLLISLKNLDQHFSMSSSAILLRRRTLFMIESPRTSKEKKVLLRDIIDSSCFSSALVHFETYSVERNLWPLVFRFVYIIV